MSIRNKQPKQLMPPEIYCKVVQPNQPNNAKIGIENYFKCFIISKVSIYLEHISGVQAE